MHMLDFTVTRNYDSDSSSHGSSETRAGGQLREPICSYQGNQTEVDNSANDVEDEEATGHDIPEERVVTDDGNVPEPELEFEGSVDRIVLRDIEVFEGNISDSLAAICRDIRAAICIEQ